MEGRGGSARILPASGRRSCGLRPRTLGEQRASIGRGFAGVLVLAVDVHLNSLAQPTVESRPPSRQLFRCVRLPAKANVSEVGGEHLGRAFFFGFSQTQGGLILAEERIGSVAVPGGMSHLQRKAKGVWPQL